MSRLRNIIRRLDENEYRNLERSLQNSRAESLHYLLRAYREGSMSDEEIASALRTTVSNMYVLRSRLSDRIQKELSGDVLNDTTHAFMQLQRLHDICFESPREIAQTMLEKLESDLRKFDLHHELLMVYSALKKINQHSEKYFRYSQLYNSHAAFNLSVEKCEELLGAFNRTLAAYDLSRNEEIPSTLRFIAAELDDHLRLNTSRQVEIIRSIAHIQLAITFRHGPDPGEMLESVEKSFSELPDASHHKKWQPVVDCLWFEYWLRERKPRRAAPFYERIMPRMRSILLYSPVCLTPRFLLSRITYLISTNDRQSLGEDVTEESLRDPLDLHAAVIIAVSSAVAAYFRGEWRVATLSLNTLLNRYPFKDQVHALIEIKLLLAFFYLAGGEDEMGKSVVRGLSRKIKAECAEKYAHGLKLIRVLLTGIKDYGPTEKQDLHMRQFLDANSGPLSLLPYFEVELRKRFTKENS